MNTVSEVRGFTENNLYQGNAGIMAGGATSFIAQMLIRDIGQAFSAELLFGNYNDPAGVGNTQGWRFVREVDEVGPPNNMLINAEIYGGADSLVAGCLVPTCNSRGKITHVALAFLASTGSLTLYANGGPVVNDTDGAFVPISSVLGPTLGGHSLINMAVTKTGIIAASFSTGFEDDDDIDAMISNCYLETLKRNDLATTSALPFAYHYNLTRNAGYAGGSGTGYPRVLDNYGTAGVSGDMEKEGSAAVTIGTPCVIWSSGAIEAGA